MADIGGMPEQGVGDRGRYALANAERRVRAAEHHLAHYDEYWCGHSREDCERRVGEARAALEALRVSH